ncbi:histidine kinase [Candidatus Moduliflexus flocculans]|uniref:histidine kinase n=1 Tax=Candidatus Moduliflexus flocculans TaxID=1499966 RepID=A0A0S6W3W5_9BACT|nr:histidine kinase [Candidatus Moduliflexus flocculans]
MAYKTVFLWFFSLWKQLIALMLLATILSNLLIYLLSQQRYQMRMQEESQTHYAELETLRQRLMSAEFESADMAREIETFCLAAIQEMPTILELSIGDESGRMLWAKESPDFLKQDRSTADVYIIALPVSLNDSVYTLRGIYERTNIIRHYVNIMHITLYMTGVVIMGMFFFAIGLMALRFSQRLAAKQQQVEEYAMAMEEAKLQLRRTRKELYLSEKLASLGYLSAGIAHEIGNPLGAVLGYVEVLQKGKVDDKKRADILPRIVHEIERIRGIIQELVTFSRPHSLNIQKVDVNQVVQKMMAQFPPVKEKQIEFHLKLTGFPLFADVDAHKLQSVCLNVIQNSIDAIDKIGEITIATSRRIRESTTMISGSEVIAIQIADSGCGIPEEILPSVFDPFFTTKEPGKGMGLGLSLCHRIIESFHGEIEITSVVGKGTEVLIILPPSRKKEVERLSPESESM